MSFGRRGAQTSHRRRDEVPSTIRITEETSWLSLRDLGVGAVVLVVSFVGGFFILGGFPGQSAPTAGNPVQSAAASLGSDPPPVPRSYKKKGPVPFIVGTSWMMALKMQQTPEGFDGIDSELHERCMKPTDRKAAQYAEVRGKTFLRPEAGAAFLACSMRVYKSRFCEPHYRERLVQRLEEFVRARREHIAVVEKARNTKVGRMAIEINEASSKGGVTSGYLPTEFVPAQLAVAIHELSESGLLSQSDFNGLFSSTPEELKRYLPADVKSSCT